MSEERIAVVTPAHNELAHVDALVAAMAGQTLRPVRWVIVDDGSTDGTAEAARSALRGHDWAEVHPRPARDRMADGRSFASKAAAVNRGAARLAAVEYDYLACVDADVRLPPQYLAEVVRRFAADPDLGVAGGTYRHPVGTRTVPDRPPEEHVPGPAQVFRRQVFEQIGGYWAMRHGGVDTAANVAARMRGWATRSFPDLEFDHGRRMGTGGGRRPLAAEWHKGLQDRDLGSLPAWVVLRSLRRLSWRPYVIGSLARLAGFGWATARGGSRSVDDAFVAHVRAEQRARLRGMLAR